MPVKLMFYNAHITHGYGIVLFVSFFIVKGENKVFHVRSNKLPGIAAKSSKATFIKFCNDKY